MKRKKKRKKKKKKRTRERNYEKLDSLRNACGNADNVKTESKTIAEVTGMAKYFFLDMTALA